MFAGRQAECRQHSPFGVPQRLPGDRHRYTGHLRDAESGNDFAGARYDSNARGRWLSVDPVLGDLANPQRLNRYAYVLNNPVLYVDPDGRGEEPFDTGFRIVVSSGVLYVTTSIHTLSHSLFGLPQRPAKAGLEGTAPANLGEMLEFFRAVQEGIRIVTAALDPEKIRPECRSLFEALGIDPTELVRQMGQRRFWDASRIATPFTQLFSATDPRYETWAGSWLRTVQNIFDMSITTRDVFASRPGLTAVAIPSGYANVVLIRDLQSVSPGLLAHETLHGMGLDDTEIQNAWGMKRDPKNTRTITDKVRDSCL